MNCLLYTSKSGYSRSRLLMPLVFAAAMGGNLSLIGAPGNMIAQSQMESIGLKFGFFDYAKVGVPILIVGIIYFALIGYKFLPNKTDAAGDSIYDEVQDFSNVPKWKPVSYTHLDVYKRQAYGRYWIYRYGT